MIKVICYTKIWYTHIKEGVLLFKKLYFKFALWSLLTSFIILITAATVSSFSTAYFCYKRFVSEVKSVAESVEGDLKNYSNVLSTEDFMSFNTESVISKYNGYLGINENRSIFIINSDDLSIFYPKSFNSDSLLRTQNFELALNGDEGAVFSLGSEYMDYATAFEIKNFPFVLYVRDNKSEMRSLIINNMTVYAWLLIPGALIALIIAFILASIVKKPIKNITKRAEGFEKAEIAESIDNMDCTEFNELLRAVNHMGYVMAESIRRMNSDKHKVEVILEHINNGIITFDNEQNTILINSAARRILNVNTDEKDIKFDSFFKKLGADVCMAEFLYLGKSKIIEKEIKKDSGYIKVWFIPFKMDEERNAGVVCVLEDITEQFNVMEAMRKFVADVSHELKTPITVISSYTETVLNGYLDDKAMSSNLLNIVYQEAGKMTELVQNLLDISKYEMKAIERSDEPFSVDEMLLSLVNTFEMEAEKKELDLSYTRMSEIPLFKGSRNDVERAVKNIISNSIKYTSRGDKIRIYAGKLHNEIYIKIEDTGWGIPENKLGHLFERFYRVEDEARSRDKGGTGLGLSIAKEIIESHNGNIKIESEYTKYTRVTITLPINKE